MIKHPVSLISLLEGFQEAFTRVDPQSYLLNRLRGQGVINVVVAEFPY
jgi:hypothetical protein